MSGSTSPTPCAYMGDPIDHLATGNLFIGISGLIGAGKSTLATALAKEMNLPPVRQRLLTAAESVTAKCTLN